MSTAYGDHAERAATAMARLVHGDALPATPQHQSTALGARDIIISVLRDRLHDQFATQVRNSDPRADKTVAAPALQAEPLVELAYVLERLPRLPAEARRAPTDVLARVEEPITSAWVETARNLLVADHILATAGSRPWLTNPAAHAALAADTAQLVEAIVVLDERLNAVGALADHVIADREADAATPSARPMASDATARLLASTVDKLAFWAADHTSIDLAYTTPTKPPEHEHPVRLVQVPGDLAAGQRRLKAYLSPMANGNARGPSRLSADTANVIALNQTGLLVDLHQRIKASPELGEELGRVEALMDAFGQAVHAIRGLHDITGPREQRLLRGQQREISVGVRMGHVRALTDRQVGDLLTASESALATWAGAVRREASRKTTTFQIARRGAIDAPVYGRLSRDGSGMEALTGLAEITSRRPGPVEEVSTRGRSELRDTLTQTPPVETVEFWPGPGRRHHRAPAGHSAAAPPPRR